MESSFLLDRAHANVFLKSRIQHRKVEADHKKTVNVLIARTVDIFSN